MKRCGNSDKSVSKILHSATQNNSITIMLAEHPVISCFTSPSDNKNSSQTPGDGPGASFKLHPNPKHSRLLARLCRAGSGLTPSPGLFVFAERGT